mmetsp:Transcript_26194/g.70867  ORF Transcript_26194/g.70867 Transcript_26194/m.70867 type:complete len:80 (+) Transcript_26194:646-885(+)
MRDGRPTYQPHSSGSDPFDNLPFLLCVAQTFGGQVNLQAMQVIDMLVLTFKALAFTALVVKMHLIDPFQEKQQGQQREP